MRVTLYKKDSKGKCRVWSCEAKDEGGLLEISGLETGQKVQHHREVKPKNVGRSNETTVQEQSQSERSSKYKKKLDTGYFYNKEEAMNTEVLLPMLASSYKDFSHKVDWKNAYVQPKLDGMRCFIIIDGTGIRMVSRKGILITTMNHILNGFAAPTSEGRIIFDGELYAHGLTFQENMKLIKKERANSVQVHFHCYDAVLPCGYLGRHEYLSSLLNSLANQYVELVSSTVRVFSEEQMMMYHDKFLKEGYEGSMLRHGEGEYTMDKRSQGLLKVKDFIDEVYKVTDIISAEADPTQGVLVCKMESGYTFKAAFKGTHTERRELLSNKENYVGQTAEVRFFEFTDGGVPRFPICVGFRLDK